MADQDQDRVAAVVARAIDEIVPRTRSTFAWGLVDALDAAGLLLTEERRGRWTRIIHEARRSLYMRGAQQIVVDGCDALLRELAGDGGVERTNPFQNIGWGSPSDRTDKPEPTPAPRRMAGHPGADPGDVHSVEHDKTKNCALHPPCQPVAAVDPTPAHEHRWAPIAWEVVNLTATRVTREHCTRGDCRETREVSHG